MDLAHVRRGSGPPVIVIQQLDPPEFWAETVADLSTACEVIAVDLPGFGASPPLPHGRSPSVSALTDAVAAWVARAALNGAYVVGNSLGGAVAIEMAKRSAVAGGIAISPVGFWTRREAARALRSIRIGRAVARAVVARPGLVTRTGVGRALAFWQLVARPWRMPEHTARAALIGMATAPGLEATRRELMTYRLQGPEPAVPVTVAWAAKDRMTPPHQARRAAAILPHASVVTLPGCGHAAMVEDPAGVARVVREAMAQDRRSP